MVRFPNWTHKLFIVFRGSENGSRLSSSSGSSSSGSNEAINVHSPPPESPDQMAVPADAENDED